MTTRDEIRDTIAEAMARASGWPGRGDKFVIHAGPIADAVLALLAKPSPSDAKSWSSDELVHVGGCTCDPVNDGGNDKHRPLCGYEPKGDSPEDFADAINLAISDPGAFTKRGDNYQEPVTRWGARAVLIVLRAHGYGKRPTYTRQQLVELWWKTCDNDEIAWVFPDHIIVAFARALDVEVAE